MTQIDAIANSIQFIEEHLHQTIDVQDMADVAGYSLYHFCRIFSKATRHTPHDYLIRRRMTCAAKDILRTQKKIVDIAFDYQFESHEGFTRAFRRMFGISPSEARDKGVVKAWSSLPPLSYQHLVCLHEARYLIPEFTDCPALDILNPTMEIESEHSIQVTNLALTTALYGSDSWLIALPDPLSSNPPHTQRMKLSYSPTTQSKQRMPQQCARFNLYSAVDNVPLIFDWVLHTWLFYTQYELSGIWAIMKQKSSIEWILYLPVDQ